MIWYYLLLKKDSLTGTIGKPVAGYSQSIDTEEIIVCSDPKQNFPYPDATITHPLDMLDYLREKHRTRVSDTIMGNDRLKTITEWQIMFWSEIPEAVALKWKERE